MRSDLVKILDCPDCGGELQLCAFDVKRIRNDCGEKKIVVEGILLCKKCSRWFPIIHGIPWLYPKNLRNRAIERDFLRRHTDKKIINEILLRELREQIKNEQ